MGDRFDFKKHTDFGYLWRIERIVIFDVDSRLCLSYVRILNPKGNLCYTSSVSVGKLMSSLKSFHFSREVHLNSSVRLLLELYCVIGIKHVPFFTLG